MQQQTRPTQAVNPSLPPFIVAIPEALAQFSYLPDSAFIRLPVLKRLYGISAASYWRGVLKGTIPKPVKLSERCTAWNVGLIKADLAAKAGA